MQLFQCVTSMPNNYACRLVDCWVWSNEPRCEQLNVISCCWCCCCCCCCCNFSCLEFEIKQQALAGRWAAGSFSVGEGRPNIWPPPSQGQSIAWWKCWVGDHRRKHGHRSPYHGLVISGKAFGPIAKTTRPLDHCCEKGHFALRVSLEMLRCEDVAIQGQ